MLFHFDVSPKHSFRLDGDNGSFSLNTSVCIGAPEKCSLFHQESFVFTLFDPAAYGLSRMQGHKEGVTIQIPPSGASEG